MTRSHTPYVNVRYSLSAEEHDLLKRIQANYQAQLGISKLSQTDVLRFMLRDVLTLQKQK